MIQTPKNFFLFVIAMSVLVSGLLSIILIRTQLMSVGIYDSRTWEWSQSFFSGAQLASIKSTEQAVKYIASKVGASVVSINISQDVQTYRSDPFGFFFEPSGTVRKKIGGGTGFFIRSDGLLLTNKHVVSDATAKYTVITSNDSEYSAKVVATDPTNDLAVMQIVDAKGNKITNTPYVSFVGDGEKPEIGSFVVAIWNALAEFQNTLTFGVVSGLGRTIEAQSSGASTELLSGLIQTDAAINSGNSGGPLINLDGKVVGINTATTQGASGLGFSIPLSQKEVNFLISSIEKYGSIKRPAIGVRYIELTPGMATALGVSDQQGAMIPLENGIIAGSSADKAGLQLGDIILEVDGQKITSKYTLKDAMTAKFPGDVVSLKVKQYASKKVVLKTLTLSVATPVQ